MKVIYNKYLPFKGFVAIMLFGVVFVRKEHSPISPFTRNHELIHCYQWVESFVVGIGITTLVSLLWRFHWTLLFIPPLLWYVSYLLEYLYQLVWSIFSSKMLPYHFIGYEQEAYDNMYNCSYLNTRKPFAWFKYVGKLKKY